MTTRYPRRSTYPHSASQSAEAVGTGSRAPVGTATPAATSSAASATSEAAGTPTSTKPVSPSPTLTSAQASAVRSTTRNGRLSSSSFATTTPVTISSAGSSRSAVTMGPTPATGRGASSASASPSIGSAGPNARSAGSSVRSSRCAARSAADRSTSTYRSARAHSGSARNTSDARRPRPAPASTTKNGSGRESSDQAPSRERAIKAPNNTPTSGLVTKSLPARPAPPPRAKNPPGSSYRAASTKRSNGIGPSRRMRSAMRSASASVPVLGMEKHAMRPNACRERGRRRSAREGHLADPGEQLRVDADHDDDGGGQAERDAERGRRPRRNRLDAGLGGITEPHAARDACVIEERDHRVHGGDDTERVRRCRPGIEDRSEHDELGEPPRQRRDPGQREQEPRHQQREHRRGLAEPGVRGDLARARPAGDGDDDRERAQVHRAVDQQVDDDRFERRAGRVPVRRACQWGAAEPALRDGRVGQHADDVRLA